MKRPSSTERKSDDKACKAETGKSRDEWFKAIDKSGAAGRSAVGKFLLGEKVDAWWITTLLVDYEAAKGIVEKDGRPKGYSICSTKSVDVSAAQVYKALTKSPDYFVWFGAGAAVKKLNPDKSIKLSCDSGDFATGSQVEILIQPKTPAKTGLVVNHTRIDTRRDADDAREAWAQGLNALKEQLER